MIKESRNGAMNLAGAPACSNLSTLHRHLGIRGVKADSMSAVRVVHGEGMKLQGECVIALQPPAAIVPLMTLAKRLLHTRYRVNDLNRTVKFYTEVLGLVETRRHESPRGSELVFLKAPESEELIEICHFPDGGPVQVQPDLTHLAFEVESLEAFSTHLAQHGLKYSDGPHLQPDGSGFAFIDAPEGYEIELMQRGSEGGY